MSRPRGVQVLQLQPLEPDRRRPGFPVDRNFLHADWTHNHKRFRKKSDPDVVVDVDRNTDPDSVALGTWTWTGPPGFAGGPCRTVEDCLRAMDRAWGHPFEESPRAHWRGVARTLGGPLLRLVR